MIMDISYFSTLHIKDEPDFPVKMNNHFLAANGESTWTSDDVKSAGFEGTN